MILLGGLFAALGSVAGASMAYWAARLGGRPFVDQLARWVRIDQAHIDSTERHFQHWGVKVVFFGRVIPGLRTLVSIPAGLARMNYLKFFIATFSGAYLWCTLLIGVGYILGHEWHLISEYIKLAFPYLAAAAVLALAVYFMQTRNLFALAWAKIRKND
jgi:membrane protein DedA with SNARE-associated domain